MKNETDDMVSAWFPDTSGMRRQTSQPEGAYKWGHRIESPSGLHELCQGLPFRDILFLYRGKSTRRCRLLCGHEKASLVIASSRGDELSTTEMTRAIENSLFNGNMFEKVEFRLKEETGHQLTPYRAETQGADLVISLV